MLPPVRSVQAQVKILNIWNVDTITETFNVELRITVRWEVTNLPHVAADARENGLDRLDVDWEPEWVPRFSLWGCIARDDLRSCYAATCRSDAVSDGQASEVWIEGAQWINAQLSETYDLRSFPFDVQDTNIHLTLDNCPVLVPLDRPTRWQHNAFSTSMVRHVPLTLPNFTLRFAFFCTHSTDPAMIKNVEPQMLRRLREKHRLDIVLVFQRKQSYYVYNYFGLLICIGTASLASFAVHWREVASRLGIDITLLLVAFAFKHEISANTPDIAYLTTLDLFAIAVIGFVFLCTMLHAYIGMRMYDCDMLTGECTMGEYWLWDNSVRDVHWNISADAGPSAQRTRQDEHMAIGYRTDAWCKSIYTALWIGWLVYFWLWHVRQLVGFNTALLQRSRIFDSVDMPWWQKAADLPKPMAWWDDHIKDTSKVEALACFKNCGSKNNRAGQRVVVAKHSSEPQP